MEKVSVIIPTYERPLMLKQCLRSVLEQSYLNLEIIVIDDNAKNLEMRNETQKIIEEFKDENRILFIKNKENLGGALSRNKGIEAATGKFICFLDDDDQYTKDKIKKQYEEYKKKFPKDNGILYCQASIYKNGKKISSTKSYVKGNRNGIKESMKTGITSTGTLFIPKKIILEVGGFEKLICGQEWFLILKILKKGYEIDYIKDELLIYNEHNLERISNNIKKIEGEKELYKIKKSFFRFFTDDEIKDIKYYNYIMFAMYTSKTNKNKSLSYLFKANKIKRIRLMDFFKVFSFLVFSEKVISKIRYLKQKLT